MRGDVLRALVVRGVFVVKSFQLQLKLPLSLTSSLEFLSLCLELGLLLLLLLLCASPALLFFRPFELALLHLLLESLESSLSRLALFCQFIFLSAFFVPRFFVSESPIFACYHLLHALGLSLLSLLLLPESLLSDLILCPLSLGFGLLCVMLGDVHFVLP